VRRKKFTTKITFLCVASRYGTLTGKMYLGDKHFSISSTNNRSFAEDKILKKLCWKYVSRNRDSATFKAELSKEEEETLKALATMKPLKRLELAGLLEVPFKELVSCFTVKLLME